MGGPDRLKHLRNAGIIVILAVIVWLVPGGDNASITVSNLLGIAFAAGLIFLVFRLYMEHRDTIMGLGDRRRGILYGSVGLAAIALIGTRRLWETGGGAIVWLALMALAVYGLWSVWQAYRSY